MATPEHARAPQPRAATNRNGSPTADAVERKRVAPLTIVLGVVFVVFCGILIFVYVATKRANPIMLDGQGRPLDQGASSSSSGGR